MICVNQRMYQGLVQCFVDGCLINPHRALVEFERHCQFVPQSWINTAIEVEESRRPLAVLAQPQAPAPFRVEIRKAETINDARNLWLIACIAQHLPHFGVSAAVLSCKLARQHSVGAARGRKCGRALRAA